jgi:proteic killer suppression protein
MIVSFKDEGTRDVWYDKDTRAARQTCPTEIWPMAKKKLDVLDRAESLRDLALPLGNGLERLKGDRAGQHSVRINRQYRICFRWTSEGPTRVEIVDYH